MAKTLTSRRRFLIGTASLALAGCAGSPITVVSPVLGNVVRALRFALFGAPSVPINRAAISNLPYASITGKIGTGPRSLLILDRIKGEERHWLSADRVAIVTRRGRVIRTAGLPENLRETRFVEVDPVAAEPHRLNAPLKATRMIDLDKGSHYGMPIESVLVSLGERTITIVEIDFETILIREDNVAKTVNWTFTNFYWVDKFDGFVWKSRQHIARTFPPIEIEVLKPAA